MHPIEHTYQIFIWVLVSSGTFSKFAKITTQNSIFLHFEAIFFKFVDVYDKNSCFTLDVHSMLNIISI